MNTLPILYQRLFFINHILSYFSTRKNTMEYRTGKPEVYSWTSLQRVSLSLVRGLSKPPSGWTPADCAFAIIFLTATYPSWSSWTAWTRWPWERWWQMQSVGRDCSHGVQLCKNCNEDEEVWTLEWAEWILLRWSVLVSGLSQCVASYTFAQRLFALFDRLAFSDSSFEGFHPVSKNLFSHGSNHCRVPACWTVRLLTLWMQNDNEKRRPGEESQDGKESEDDRRWSSRTLKGAFWFLNIGNWINWPAEGTWQASI